MFKIVLATSLTLLSCGGGDKSVETQIDLDFGYLIPDGYQLNYYKQADLNGDKIEDLILIAHSKSEKENSSVRLARPVLVYFGQRDGSFQFKGRNDFVRLDASYETPNERNTLNGVAVKDNYFTIENSYGASVTFTRVYYTFKVLRDTIFFHRLDDSVYEVLESNTGPELVNLTTVYANEIGNPTFSDYRPGLK